MKYNYKWLMDIGFEEDDLRDMCDCYCDSALDIVFDEYLQEVYVDSLDIFE